MPLFYRIPAVFVMLLFTLTVIQQTSQAQAFRIVTINTFAGAVTGASLGGATMALQNKSEADFYPMRFGVGMGTIMGLGTGFYDISKMTGGAGFYVDGMISSANSTGTIILLDTFYGAATGAVVGTAISLMTEAKIVKGLQYGSGAGAWVGFAFGLVDAFALSSAGDYDSFYDEYASNFHSNSSGLFQIRDEDNSYAMGFLNPMFFNSYSTTDFGSISSRTHFGIELTRINISL